MGKQKRERRKPSKKNPTGLPSVKDFELAEAENITNEDQENALQRVYEDVQSANVEEVLSGLQTLESMSCNSKLAVQIAKDGIAKLIGPLLVDRNVLVRAESAMTLRNIADNGKAEAYESLLKDDIMTPLCSLLKQYYTDWQLTLDQNEKNKVNDEKKAFVQAVTLLWTLCENNELAVKYSNQEDLACILTKFFDITIYGIEIVTVTVQCLLSLSEDNTTAIDKLKSCENTLLQLLNIETNDFNISDVIYLKTAVTGLLISLFNYVENDSMSTVSKGVAVLSETLSIDCKELLSNLSSILPHEKNTFLGSARKKVQDSRKIFGSQQLALEILTNLCSEEQESDNDSNLDNSDCESDSIDDVDMDDKLFTAKFSLPMEVIEVFNSCNIIKKVWDKTLAVDKDTVEILEQNVEGQAILQQMHTLNCTAYLCLNNLISHLEIDILGGMENVYRMWADIGTVIFKDGNPKNIELLESATTTMRAALQRLSEAKPNIFNQLTLTDIELMLNGERQCPNANVRANLIRMLGNLVLILINSGTPESYELIKYVSTFLLNTCTVEPKAWVIAESLDAIMDAYSEDNSDQLAREIKLTETLRDVIPRFKNIVGQQKKTLGDNIAIVSTVNSNITRFIKYKEKRIKNV
ncbi:HEAT repeat-containing protein 3 [Hylaeus anthracinus]|uniref:HEAT repeat-containing protein 3 n=1 Tax=Hylaeus anthracinus TaxID=313031 RepID=UPI0023B917A2|nr:HEAT repeat-containing protein 3 [Hylaeus anthracinus]